MANPAPAIITAPNKQTGPRTAAGKERSSSNATLDGGTSTRLIVAGETQAESNSLLNTLMSDYQPDTEQSRLFVESVATANWFLWRRQRACNAIEAAVYQEEQNPANWTEKHLQRLSLADRYKTRAERSLQRDLTSLEGWQKSSRREADRAFRFAKTTAAPESKPSAVIAASKSQTIGWSVAIQEIANRLRGAENNRIMMIPIATNDSLGFE